MPCLRRLLAALALSHSKSLGEIICTFVLWGQCADFRPSAHVERLEMMDLVAVKEATDSRFLPARFRSLSLGEINQRLERLRFLLGE